MVCVRACVLASLFVACIRTAGFETGQIMYAFFEKFQIAADWVSFVFVLYNFAVVGAVGILYGKIVPRTLSQGYLIVISICICYLLRYFPEWTGWILLVLLALWDLFAVLAPCGPLKALVKMASERQDPIPGLLYTVRCCRGTLRLDHLVWPRLVSLSRVGIHMQPSSACLMGCFVVG